MMFEKINVDNYAVASQYKELLNNVLYAFRNFNRNDGSLLCMSKVSNDAQQEYSDLDMKLWNYLRSQDDMDLSIVKPGQVYKYVRYEFYNYRSPVVSLFYVTGLSVNDNGVRTVRYDEIKMQDANICLNSENYDFADNDYTYNTDLIWFVAHIMDERYQLVDENDWKTLIEIKKSQKEIVMKYVNEYESARK